MEDRILAEAINERLHREYRVLDGRPIYRVVWSSNLFETRVGKFSDYYGSIFIREVQAVRKIPKYWYFNKPCYVLEKLVFIQGQYALDEICKELVDARNGDYTSIYRFCDFNNAEEPLPLNARVVDIVLWQLHNPTKVLPSDVMEEMIKAEADEVKYFEEELGKRSENIRSPLFVFENGVAVSTEQLEYRKKMTYTETSNAQLTGVEGAITTTV